jgi:hypothetical protein
MKARRKTNQVRSYAATAEAIPPISTIPDGSSQDGGKATIKERARDYYQMNDRTGRVGRGRTVSQRRDPSQSTALSSQLPACGPTASTAESSRLPRIQWVNTLEHGGG